MGESAGKRLDLMEGVFMWPGRGGYDHLAL